MIAPVAIITGGTEDVAALEAVSFPTKRAYCERWRYHLEHHVGWQTWEAHANYRQHLGFARIKMLKNRMEKELAKPKADRVQYLFWMDADSAITNPDVALHTLLDTLGAQAHVFATYDFNGFHSGTMVFRVSRQSLEILEAVWESDPKYDDGHWYEQGALHDVLVARDAYRMGEVYILDKRILNGYPNINRYRDEDPSLVPWVRETYIWKPWSFVVHIPNHPPADKINVMIHCLTVASEWQNRRQTILPGDME